jgi:hypothetical protein
MVIRKKILTVIILLAGLLLAGYFLISHFFINAASELDAKTPEEQEQTLVESEQFGDLEEVAALKEQVELIEEGKSPIVGKPSGGIENSNGSAGGADGGSKDSGTRTSSKKSIETNLRSKMYALQAEYNGKLNALASRAKAEYVRLRSSNSKVNLNVLASKYIGMGNSLEAQCDARVYAAIAFAENQLEYYSYQSSIPDKAREQYRREKAQRRKSMLNSIR